jgi:hypothetical protein
MSFRSFVRVAAIAMLVVTPASLAHAEGSAASRDAKDPKARFAEAAKLYKAGRFAEALPAFEALARETQSPNAALYVGHCLKGLGRRAEAYLAFESSAKGSGNEERYAETRSAALSELAELGLHVAKLVVSPVETPEGLSVKLDGQPLEAAAFGMHRVLEPGAHRVEAEAPGRAPVSQDVRIEGGETRTVTLLLKSLDAPAPAPSPPSRDSHTGLRVGGFVAAGVGTVGLATFVVAGLGAKSTRDDLEHDCGTAPCLDAKHRDDADRGRSLQTVANVGLVVGVVGAAAGGALLYFGYKGDASTPSVGLSVVPQGMTASVRGRF